jgi:hypothetical protein
MQFLLGLLTAVVFFLCLYTAFWIGQKRAKKPTVTKPLSEEEEERIKEAKRHTAHFQKLWTYDTDKALQRKKVM